MQASLVRLKSAETLRYTRHGRKIVVLNDNGPYGEEIEFNTLLRDRMVCILSFFS